LHRGPPATSMRWVSVSLFRPLAWPPLAVAAADLWKWVRSSVTGFWALARGVLG
jgi:hypothetical protein